MPSLKEGILILKRELMVTLLIIVFCLGYAAIAFEHVIHLNKAATALITGVICWTIFMVYNNDSEIVNHHLESHLGSIAGILFFLLGAMTIVELIDSHEGFEIITQRIRKISAKKLLWTVCLLAFFLSAMLDNLTTAIVMVSLVRKLVGDQKKRLLLCGMIVIAANAGGAWSPIGDVTTTMLWIGGQLTTSSIILHLFIPSIITLLVPLLLVGPQFKGPALEPPISDGTTTATVSARDRSIVFYSGLTVLILVPVFKTFTHLPPYMGMLLGLGIIWVITEILHAGKSSEDKNFFSVVYAIRKADTPSILFFLGILLMVAVLETTGVLVAAAEGLQSSIGNNTIIVGLIGLFSAVVDNVPLVAASMGMYSLDQFHVDHNFWLFLAYCTGTGGSILIIGSAAGVAAMGIEKIEFGWYLKKIAWIALIGYLAGIATFLLLNGLV